MGLGPGAAGAVGTKRQHASCAAACRMTLQKVQRVQVVLGGGAGVVWATAGMLLQPQDVRYAVARLHWLLCVRTRVRACVWVGAE